MKRTVVLLAGAAVFFAAPALARINPTSPGLPGETNATPWPMTAARGYAAANVTGNPASAMCVECHEVNPSNKIATPSNSGSGYLPGRTVAADWGTHAVMNTWATGQTSPIGVSNSGGGFPGAFDDPGTWALGQGRGTGQYMKVTAWAGTNGRSKYNEGTYVTTLAPTNMANADMICESCHNILTNAGDQLVLDAYDNASTDTLCLGCHGGTYTGFHAIGNLPNFNRADRKRHHVLPGDSILASYYNPDGNDATNDSIMWAPKFSNWVHATWCATPYATGVAAAEITFPFTPTFRNACNVSGAGTRNTALAAGDIATGDTVPCTSCHRPHNAQTGSGAFIFRSGNGEVIGTANTLASGIRRQTDVGNWTTTKIYGEYVRLCSGCHQGYGN